MAIECQYLGGILHGWLNVEVHVRDKYGEVLSGPLRKREDEFFVDTGDLQVCFYADDHVGDWVEKIWSHG